MKSKVQSRFVTLAALATLILISQTGCSSYFKRQECEKTNWYEYGQKVAMSGKRLSGDQFVADCRKVEAEIREVDLDNGFKQGMSKYCQPTQVFALGKSGEFFSSEMCDGENPRLLGERHKAGVLEYCKKSNGYSAGAAGKPYNGICPKDLEGAFMPEFRRGRKKYLAVLVIENEKKIGDIDREILNLESQRNTRTLELAHLQSQRGLVVERYTDPATGTVQERTSLAQTEAQKRAAEDARWRVQNLDSEINSKRQQQIQLRDKNREIQLEAVALDDQGQGST